MQRLHELDVTGVLARAGTWNLDARLYSAGSRAGRNVELPNFSAGICAQGWRSACARTLPPAIVNERRSRPLLSLFREARFQAKLAGMEHPAL